MSSPLMGSSATMILLGGASAIASALKAVSVKVVVEPSVLKTMSLIGAPFLLAETYHDIVMEKEVCATAISEREVLSLYLEKGLLSLIDRPKKGRDLERALSPFRLSREEILTITLALGRSHDRLFLSRPQAREVARGLGLEPSHPFMILVDSLHRGVINPNMFSDLVKKLLMWDGWHVNGGRGKGTKEF